tara:strand:- start:786 stop:1034 length:249 start_codon:yes stop_codon:yes gene_type:complete
MAKYKKLTPELIEGFLDKMFGRIATQAGKQVAKDMGKKDPKVGKKLARVAALVKDIENDMKGMSKAQQSKFERDLWKRAGVK